MDVNGGSRMATLGVRVEQTGAESAKAALLEVGDAGDKAAKKVTQAFQQTTASVQQAARNTATAFSNQFEAQFDADQARISEGIARGFLNPQQAKEAGREAAIAYNQGVLSQLDNLGRAGLNVDNSQVYRELADGLKATSAEQVKAAAAAGSHSLQLGRLRMEATTLAGSLTGTNGALDRVLTTIGAGGIGDIAIIGAVAGVIALTKAYQAWNESADKAKEEQDKLTASLLKWYDTQKDGTTTNLQKEIDAMRVKVKDLRTEIDKINSGNFLAALSAIGEGGSKVNAFIRILTSGNPVAQFATEVANGFTQVQQAADKGKEAMEAAKKEEDRLNDESTRKKLQEQWKEIAFQLDQAAVKTAELEAAGEKITRRFQDQGVEISKLNAALVGYRDGIAYLIESANTIESQVSKIGARNTNIAFAGLDQSAVDAARTILRDARDIARAIDDAANAGVDLAEAFGLLDRNMGDAIASIARLAAGIGPLVEQVRLLKVPDGMGGSIGSYGAVIGAALPVVGGITSLVGAITSMGDASREAKAAMDQLRAAIKANSDSVQHELGNITDAQYQRTQDEAARTSANQQIQASFAGQLALAAASKNFKELSALQQQLDAAIAANNLQYKELEAKHDADAAAAKKAADAEDALAKARLEQQNVQDTHLRILNATGQDDAAFAYQQQLEIEKDIADGLSDVGLALVAQAQAAENDQREREKQTTILQDQLSTQQQELQSFKAVADSLAQFKSSLTIGQYSPLSPRQQLDASHANLNSVYQAALGGDVNAGNQFSSVAQQFLDSSRKYNASGAGYVLDFNSVNVMTDALQHLFGSKVSDTQKQIDLLQSQIDALKDIGVVLNDVNATIVTVNTNLGNLQQAIGKANVDGISEVKEAVDNNAITIKQGLDKLTAQMSRIKTA